MADAVAKREYFPYNRMNMDDAVDQPYVEMERGLPNGELAAFACSSFITFYDYSEKKMFNITVSLKFVKISIISNIPPQY